MKFFKYILSDFLFTEAFRNENVCFRTASLTFSFQILEGLQGHYSRRRLKLLNLSFCNLISRMDDDICLQSIPVL